MTRTHLILDGLTDPALGRRLSGRWAKLGFENEVDVSGQSAWISADRHSKDDRPLTESEVDRAAGIARAFGLEVRDRVGQTFVADNALEPLRQRMAYEYKSRFATALVFVLPAVALHYIGPMLAHGTGQSARHMLYPWLFELLLVGWACLAAGWPILWQGALSLIHLRATADLLTSLILIAAFVPSAVGALGLIFGAEPWFGSAGPAFHACAFTLSAAVFGRWMVYRHVHRIAGRADLMIDRFSRWIVAWIALSALVLWGSGWQQGLAIGMLLPPMLSLGGVNRTTPGVSVALPVLGFVMLMLLGPTALNLNTTGVEVEIAFGFALVMSLAMARGWRRFGVR